jgi:ribosomal protein L12E/L44/L45/RPP1/RPP2
LIGLFGQAAKTLSCAMSPAKTDKTAQPSSSSSSSNREIEDEDEDDDEDDQDGSFLFPIRPQAGGPTEP